MPEDKAMAPTGVSLFGSPVPWVVSEHTPLKLLTVCGRTQAEPWDSAVHDGVQASWGSGMMDNDKRPRSAQQLVARYRGVTGAQVISSLRQALSCGSVTFEGEAMKPYLDLSLPRLGVDAQYGFCAGLGRNHALPRCALLLARGDRATVVVSGFYHPGTDQQAFLVQAAPIFAAALSRA